MHINKVRAGLDFQWRLRKLACVLKFLRHSLELLKSTSARSRLKTQVLMHAKQNELYPAECC